MVISIAKDLGTHGDGYQYCEGSWHSTLRRISIGIAKDLDRYCVIGIAKDLGTQNCENIRWVLRRISMVNGIAKDFKISKDIDRYCVIGVAKDLGTQNCERFRSVLRRISMVNGIAKDFGTQNL